jgi:hypothetical protein
MNTPPHTHTHTHTRTHTHTPTHTYTRARMHTPWDFSLRNWAWPNCERYPLNNFNTQHMKDISMKTLCEVTNCKLHLTVTCLSIRSTCDQSPYSPGKYSEYSVLGRAISFLACMRNIAGLQLIGTKNTLPAGFPRFFQSLQTSRRPSPRPQATCASFMLMNIILQSFN